MKTKLSPPTEIKVVKDDARIINNWFIVDPRNGYKINWYGYETKKAAVNAYEALFENCGKFKFDSDDILTLEGE